MRNVFIVLGLIISVVYFGCGDKVDEAKDAFELMKKAPDMVQNMEKGMEDSKKAREERLKRGDTLALHFTKLQGYLPKAVSGFTPNEPEGETVNMGVMSFSQAKISFTSGKQTNISIELTDYNQAVDLYAGLVFWASGYSVENSNGYEKSFNPGIERVSGFEKYSKSDKRAEVTLAIGYRFLLHLEADDQADTEMLKGIAKSMDLSGLSKL